MPKYRRKETVDAIQYRGEENMDDVIAFTNNGLRYWATGGTMTVMINSKRNATVLYGDYIIKTKGRRGLPDTFKVVTKTMFEREYAKEDE